MAPLSLLTSTPGCIPLQVSSVKWIELLNTLRRNLYEKVRRTIVQIFKKQALQPVRNQKPEQGPFSVNDFLPASFQRDASVCAFRTSGLCASSSFESVVEPQICLMFIRVPLRNFRRTLRTVPSSPSAEFLPGGMRTTEIYQGKF